MIGIARGMLSARSAVALRPGQAAACAFNATGCRTLSVSTKRHSLAAEGVLVPAAATILKEPSFISLGLAHGTPSGILQGYMEAMHVSFDLPWWATIMCTTVILRLCIFPIVVKAQKNMITLNNNMPEMQRLQVEQMKAQTVPEQREAMRRLNDFMRERRVHPLLNMFPMLCQGAVFCSMFFALRGMAELPVESLKTQGLFWFTDLTLSDPLLALPIITSLSLFVHIRLGADGLSTQNMTPFMRNFLYAMPFFSLPFMCYFPAALNVYWFTSNLVSIAQSRLIRNSKIRPLLGIEEMKQWKEEDLPMNKAMSSFYSDLAQKWSAPQKSEKVSDTKPPEKNKD